MSRTRKHAYTGSKRFSPGCRCHGSCGYCRNNRLHRDQREIAAAEQQLRDYRRAQPD